MTEYRARLFVDAVRLCEDKVEAEDLVSRTFSKAIFNLESYKEDDNLYGWMKTIMVNIHRNDLTRPVARGTTPVSSDALEMYAGADNSTDEQILKNSDHDVLRVAIEQLDPEYRKLVSLYYYNELSLKEIASFFQTSTSSVSRKLEIARKIIAAKVGIQLGKKPVAVLLAALLGVGALFGAWVSPLGDWVAEKVFGSAPAAQVDPVSTLPVTVPVSVGETVSEAGESDKKAAEPNVATPTNGNSISETPKQEGETNMNTKAKFQKTVATAACAVAVSGFSALDRSIDDYVQDGLIAQWDGIDNAATGTHVTSTNRWTDLVAKREFVFGSAKKLVFYDDRLYFPSWCYDYGELSAEDTAETFALAGRGQGTVEIYLRSGYNNSSVALQSPGGVVFSSGSGSISTLAGGSVDRYVLNWSWDNVQTNTVSVCYENTVSGDVFVNGSMKNYSTWQKGHVAESGDKTVIGRNQSNSGWFNSGSIYQIRVYNRRLWPEERQQNFWADRARFQGVVHVPADAGAAYYTGSKLVSTLTDTSFYTVTENAGGTDLGTYPVKISLVDKEKLQWDDGTTEDKTLFFTIREPVVIEPSDDDWLAIQTAIDNARWCDEIHLTAGTFSLTNMLTMTKPVTLRGANRETTILDCAGKCRGFSLGDDRAIVCDLTVTNGYVSKANGGAVTMSRGVVSNCLLTACSLNTGSSSGVGGGVYMTGGKILDCTFANCAAGGYCSKGAGVYMEGGIVSNCMFRGCMTGGNTSGGCGGWVKGGLFTNCRVMDSTDYSWCSCIYALYVEGGTVRNTLISGIADDTATSKATTITPLYLAKGTVENCTVAGNDPGSANSPAVTMADGTLVNTVIWGNNASQQLKKTGGTVSYCCFPEAMDGENGNVSGDPVFVDAVTRDFHLKDRTSAAVFAGTSRPGVAIDLDGLARPAENPSMGAFEYDAGKEPFGVVAKAGQDNYPAGSCVNVRAIVTGAADTPTYVWKVNGARIADEGEEVNLNLEPGGYEISVTATAGDKTGTGTARVAVKPTTVYVDWNGSSVFPYATKETAATNVTDALDALWLSSTSTGKVVVAAGLYRMEAGCLSETPLVFEGEGLATSTIYGATKSFGACRLCTDGSALRGLTVSNMQQGAYMTAGCIESCRFVDCGAPAQGGGVEMTGGTVRDCEFLACSANGDGYSGKGGGVYMAGGVVTNCTFRDCRTGNRAPGGCGAYVNGGLLANGRIVDSGDYGWSDKILSALYVANGTVRNVLVSGLNHDPTYCSAGTITPLYLAGGTVENCTVAGTDPGETKGPATTVAGGTLRNTIVWDNVATVQISQTGGMVEYCCFPEATEGENGNTARDPRLRKNRLGQLVLRDGSSAIDAATPCDWMTPGATDVYGNPRVKRGVPDMGCAEWQPVGLILILK